MKFATEGLVVVVEAVDVPGAFVSALVGKVLAVDGDGVGVISGPCVGFTFHTGQSVTDQFLNSYKQERRHKPI